MKRQSFKASGMISMCCGVLLLFMCSANVMAQGTSSVTGSIVDPQGNVIAGAIVTLSNQEKNFTRTQSTTERGSFAFSLIPPGQYRIEAEAKGFKKSILTDVMAQVAKPTDLTLELEIGSVEEIVTVSSGTGEVLVNKQDGTLGNNFVNKQITQLPLEARSPLALVTLQPGVTQQGYVAGARSDQSNITLDGVDINEAQTSDIDTPVLRLNAEAIEEFRVTTVNANAAAGRSSGAQISLVSKSGSNNWHGSLFWANRNTSTTANDFFNNRAGVGRPKLIRNTYGGSLGGPIVKDRLFFFYSYEGRKDISETAVTRQVPLASLGRGELRYINPSGGITTLTSADVSGIFAAGVNPIAVAALADAAAKYPANDFTTGDSSPGTLLNVGGFRFNAPTPVKLNSHSGRFDLNLTSKQVVFLRTNIIYDLRGRESQFPDTPAPNLWEHPWGFVAGHTWAISPRFVNNFRYGMTREAFSDQGDSASNDISFRFVFSPLLFSRTLSRTTPVKNITDDFSWTTGNHSLQFGTNIRLISNVRSTFANAYDDAITNPSFYLGGGSSISGLVNDFSPIAEGNESAVQNAATALIGRFSQYSALFTFDHDGTLLPPGSPANRDFRTNEYDVYAQDVWKVTPNLTLTFGLRYGISEPIWEENGFETATSIPLTTFFERRLAGAARGVPYNELISIELSGKKNNAPPMYSKDKNNFQPRFAFAYSPKASGKLFGTLLGRNNESVIRGGFGITNDYYGQQLAVSFDLNNALGFSSSRNINANTYSVDGVARPLAPLFTGYGQNIQSLPGITSPSNLTFPQTADISFNRPIQSSLDNAIIAPTHYNWNLTFERELPKGLVLQASYIGRSARNLIASRDVMALNNLVDPKSQMDWYTAAGILEDFRRRGVPASQIPEIPYFTNLFPADLAQRMNDNYWGCDACIDPTFNQTQAVYANTAEDFYANDWTDIQDVIEWALNADGSGPNNLFFHPQYGALSSFSSIAKSNYHAGTLTLRERLGTSFTADFNYTLSHSLDDASGLATSGAFGGAFILNPILQDASYADSDFDIRHIINVNSIWQLPVGRGRKFLNSANNLVDGVFGGWQLSGIFRWNSGLPVGFYGDSGVFDDARWATNWNVQSNVTRIRPIKTCPTRGGIDPPKLFGCNTLEAYQSFRNARPGESGDRNVFRVPGYVNLDLGLGKSFAMPWSENHKLQIRVEAFNVTNTQRMGEYDLSRQGFGVVVNPETATPPSVWSNFTKIQGTPRVLQFGFRYEF